MSIATMILGQSGTGKTTSLRNLNPSDVLLIQAVKKPLPFRSKDWVPCTKGNPAGSILVTDNAQTIVGAMQRTAKPIIVIDDFQYILANEFMRRVLDNETGNSMVLQGSSANRDTILQTMSQLAKSKEVAQ